MNHFVKWVSKNMGYAQKVKQKDYLVLVKYRAMNHFVKWVSNNMGYAQKVKQKDYLVLVLSIV